MSQHKDDPGAVEGPMPSDNEGTVGSILEKIGPVGSSRGVGGVLGGLIGGEAYTQLHGDVRKGQNPEEEKD